MVDVAFSLWTSPILMRASITVLLYFRLPYLLFVWKARWACWTSCWFLLKVDRHQSVVPAVIKRQIQHDGVVNQRRVTLLSPTPIEFPWQGLSKNSAFPRFWIDEHCFLPSDPWVIKISSVHYCYVTTIGLKKKSGSEFLHPSVTNYLLTVKQVPNLSTEMFNPLK